MTAHQLTLDHKQAQIALRADLMLRLAALWPALDWTKLDATYPAWHHLVSSLVHEGHARSAALAAAYLRELRHQVGVPGAAVVVAAPPPDPAYLDSVLQITGRASAKAAASRGVAQEAAMANAFVLSSGAATRMALSGGRDTITLSADADPACKGWDRVASPDACDFCLGLVDETHEGFSAHDHCGCTAQPSY